MTTREDADLIGRTVRWQAFNLHSFYMEVMDVRRNFGRTDYLLRPLSGEGEAWVDASKCSVIDDVT